MPIREALQSWLPLQPPGVNFIGPVDFVSGLGTSARGYVSALRHSGAPLTVVPWTEGFSQQHRTTDSADSGPLQVINVVHLNLDYLHGAGILDREPLANIVTPDRYNVAVVYWELETLRPEWLEVVNRFDEFWCASSFIAKAISSAFSGPVRVVRPALAFSPTIYRRKRKDFGLPDDRYIFFYTFDAGSVLGRKNPNALLDAFMAEFREDEGALFVLRVLYGFHNAEGLNAIRSIASRRSDILVTEGFLSVDDLHDFFSNIDCYVSPHRSEGLGLTILEAMAAQKPVIATPYGGTCDFITAETAFPVAYQMTPIGDGNDPYPPESVWADPSVASLRSRMRLVFDDRRRAQAIGIQGSAAVRELFSVDRTAWRARKEINRIGWTLRKRALQSRLQTLLHPR